MQRVTLADLGDLFEQPWLATLATHRKDGSVVKNRVLRPLAEIALFSLLVMPRTVYRRVHHRHHRSTNSQHDPDRRFLPNEIFAVPEIPRTLSGKKQELPIKRLLLGHAIEKVINKDAMANPGCLEWYLEFAKVYGQRNAGAA